MRLSGAHRSFRPWIDPVHPVRIPEIRLLDGVLLSRRNFCWANNYRPATPYRAPAQRRR